jgi:FKBP-type peptidyl-prolyl cis-trans isomerase
MPMILAFLLMLQPPPMPAQPAPESPIVTTASGLRFQVLEPGTGRRPERADEVRLSYEYGLASNMQVIASTIDGTTMPVTRPVPGFTEALLLMNAGGTYRFWVPARLAYGHRGNGSQIPPDADLFYTVHLNAVHRPGERFYR